MHLSKLIELYIKKVNVAICVFRLKKKLNFFLKMVVGGLEMKRPDVGISLE